MKDYEKKKKMQCLWRYSDSPISKKFWNDKAVELNSKIGKDLARRVLSCVILVNVLVLTSIVLTGCNTVNGIGQDLQSISQPYITEQ